MASGGNFAETLPQGTGTLFSSLSPPGLALATAGLLGSGSHTQLLSELGADLAGRLISIWEVARTTHRPSVGLEGQSHPSDLKKAVPPWP